MNPWESLVNPRASIPRSVMHGADAPTVLAPEPEPEKPKRRTKWHDVQFARSLRCRLLSLLFHGSMSRKDFFQLANNIAEKSGHKPDAVSVALKALMDEGLLVCEMKLTAKGLDKLGLKGPQ